MEGRSVFRRKWILVVIALLFVVASADLILNRPKDEGIQWFSLPLLATGLAILVLVFWPTSKPGPRLPIDTLASRLLTRVTWEGRLVPFFPVFGIVIVVADLAYNALVSSTPALLTHDQAVLLFGAALIAYRFVPERYNRERDFVLLFTVGLTAILVIPLLLLRLFSNNQFVSVDAYSAYALAPQTSAVLNLLGVHNSVVFVPPEPSPGLSFTTARGLQVTVFITSACSGIYSVAIFASAFAAFVLSEQRRLTFRVGLFFALGILLAYLANILRMVAIVLIGYQYDTPATGTQALLFAHSNVGWVIFLLWIALFWVLLFRFLPPGFSSRKAGESPSAQRPRRGAFCGICGIVLTPAIPATRCECAKLYHAECLATEGRCPNCSIAWPSAGVKQPTM